MGALFLNRPNCNYATIQREYYVIKHKGEFILVSPYSNIWTDLGFEQENFGFWYYVPVAKTPEQIKMLWKLEDSEKLRFFENVYNIVRRGEKLDKVNSSLKYLYKFFNFLHVSILYFLTPLSFCYFVLLYGSYLYFLMSMGLFILISAMSLLHRPIAEHYRIEKVWSWEADFMTLVPDVTNDELDWYVYQRWDQIHYWQYNTPLRPRKRH